MLSQSASRPSLRQRLQLHNGEKCAILFIEFLLEREIAAKYDLFFLNLISSCLKPITGEFALCIISRNL